MPGRNQNYLAIIGDLVGSRAMPARERANVQKKFEAVLEKVNADFKDSAFCYKGTLDGKTSDGTNFAGTRQESKANFRIVRNPGVKYQQNN